MNWRNDPITEKQEAMIATIQEDAYMNDAYVPPFNGKTKGEAYDWISVNINKRFYSMYNPHEDAGDRI